MYIVMTMLSLVISLLGKSAIDCLAKIIAFTFFYIFRARRKLMLKNLEIAFGDEKSKSELKKIAYLSVYHFVLTLLEFMEDRRGTLGQNVSISEGKQYLDKAFEDGAGAYILCIHMGSWEAMGSALTRMGFKSNVIVKKVGSEGVDNFVKERRNKNGFYTIERKKKGDAVKGIEKVLASNQAVGFVMDQARPGEPFLPFFSKPAKTNTSFAAIWRKLPAPIIPAYIIRTKVGEHIIKIKAPLNLQVTEDKEKDILDQSKYLNSVVEKMVKDCPEQYFWMHNRWKT